jgi:hypothetical protein
MLVGFDGTPMQLSRGLPRLVEDKKRNRDISSSERNIPREEGEVAKVKQARIETPEEQERSTLAANRGQMSEIAKEGSKAQFMEMAKAEVEEVKEQKEMLNPKKLDAVAKKIKQTMMLMNLMQVATDNVLKGLCMGCAQQANEGKSMVDKAMKVGEDDSEDEDYQLKDDEEVEDDASQGASELKSVDQVQSSEGEEVEPPAEGLKNLLEALEGVIGRIKNKTEEESKLDEMEQMVYQQMLFTNLAINGIGSFIDKNCTSCESKEKQKNLKPDDSLSWLYS